MSLSITSKLTLTFAFLSACILLPTTWILYWTVSDSTVQRAVNDLEGLAENTTQAIFDQLDEDLVVEFEGEAVNFSRLRVPAANWAVISSGGHQVIANGIFIHGVEPFVAAKPELVRSTAAPNAGNPRQPPFRVLATPLLKNAFLGREDLPPASLECARRAVEDGIFVNAKREASGERDAISIKVLRATEIVEVQTTDEGELLRKKREAFATVLPSGLLAGVPAERKPVSAETIEWSTWDRQLIAVVSGRTEADEKTRIAINRLGEEFLVDSTGSVTGPLETSTRWLVVATDATRELASTSRTLGVIGAGGVLAWFCLTLAGWVVSRRAMQPIETIVQTAAAIDSSRLDARVPVGNANDELARVSSTINDMLTRIESAYRREQEFTGDASHELRTPLAKVIAEIELARSQRRSPAEHEATLERLHGYAVGMEKLLDSLLILSQLQSGGADVRKERFDPNTLIVEVINSLESEEARRVSFEIGESPMALEVLGERTLIGVLFKNLIVNGLQYSPKGGSVHVRSSSTEGRLVVDVEDSGPGIPPELRAHAFQRFYRLDKSRARSTGGFGLGLAIAQGVAQVHRAEIELTEAPNGGTVARVTLPLAGS